jgi:AraC-like DNA-binding protein
MRTWITHHHASERMPRHRHAEGYAALILAGGYTEAGDNGRIRVQPGHVVAHAAHEAHQDYFSKSGATVLNIPLNGALRVVTGVVPDPDAIARLSQSDIASAATLLQETIQPLYAWLNDWPDQLAAALASPGEFSIEEWAARMGLAPPSISRGFRLAYGVSPKRYRLEQRTLRAIEKLRAGGEGLATIATDCGFADQSHFTRAVIALTGVTPKRLQVKSVQEGACACR